MVRYFCIAYKIAHIKCVLKASRSILCRVHACRIYSCIEAMCFTWNYRMHVSLLLLFAPRSPFHHKTHTHTQSSECDLDTEFLCDSISMINRPLFVSLCVCVLLPLCVISPFLVCCKQKCHGVQSFHSRHTSKPAPDKEENKSEIMQTTTRKPTQKYAPGKRKAFECIYTQDIKVTAWNFWAFGHTAVEWGAFNFSWMLYDKDKKKEEKSKKQREKTPW